jgi:ketosteroid isomerase-like protein
MRRVAVLMATIVLVLPMSLAAQEWDSDQTEVWETIVAQWEAAKAKDMTWTEKYLHPSFLGWTDTYPMPRHKAAYQEWQRYSAENSQTLVQELYPVGIVVVGSIAVAHYYYSTAAEDREGKRETTHGRYTDVLIKQDGKWIFIAWRGGDNPKLND